MSETDFYALIDFVDSKQIKPKVQGTANPIDVVAPFFSIALLLLAGAFTIFIMAGG